MDELQKGRPSAASGTISKDGKYIKVGTEWKYREEGQHVREADLKVGEHIPFGIGRAAKIESIGNGKVKAIIYSTIHEEPGYSKELDVKDFLKEANVRKVETRVDSTKVNPRHFDSPEEYENAKKVVLGTSEEKQRGFKDLKYSDKSPKYLIDAVKKHRQLFNWRHLINENNIQFLVDENHSVESIKKENHLRFENDKPTNLMAVNMDIDKGKQLDKETLMKYKNNLDIHKLHKTQEALKDINPKILSVPSIKISHAPPVYVHLGDYINMTRWETDSKKALVNETARYVGQGTSSQGKVWKFKKEDNSTFVLVEKYFNPDRNKIEINTTKKNSLFDE